MKSLISFSIFFWLLLIIFFWKIFFLGHVLFNEEAMNNIYPWRYTQEYKRTINADITSLDIPAKQATHNLIRSGQSPLWLSSSLGGRPLAANPQTQVFYPLSFLTFVMDNFLRTYSFVTIFHLFLGGLFMFLYSRYLKISWYGSLISSIVFVFNPLILQSAGLQHDVSTYTLTPLFFLIIEIAVREKNHFYLLSIAPLTGWAIFAGHLQSMLFILVGTFFYLFLRLQTRKFYPGIMAQYLALYCLGAIMGFGMGAIQLVPAMELSSLSFRTDFLTTKSLTLAGIQNIFFQRVFMEPHLPYMSIITIPLITLSCITKREVIKNHFTMILLLLVFLIIAHLFYPLINIIPGLNQSRNLTRMLLLYVFSISFIAGAGIDIVMNVSKKYAHTIQQIIKASLFLSLGLLIFLILIYNNSFAYPSILSLWSNGVHAYPLNFFIAPILLICATGVISIAKYKKYKLIVFIVFVFLFSYDFFRGGWEFLKTAKQENVFPRTEAITFLQNDPEIFRVLAYKDVLPGDMAAFFNLQSLNVYTGVYPKDPRLLITASSNPNHTPDMTKTYSVGNFTYFEPKIRNLLNIKYILASPSASLHDDALELVYDKEIKIYKNIQALPRAYIVDTILVVPSHKEALEKVFSEDVNIKNTVVLEENTILEELKQKKYTLLTNPKTDVKIISYKAGEIIVESKGESDAILVLSENFYPGWKAYIDKKQAKIMNANFAFQAIFLPLGSHTIRFVFDPDSLKYGLWISVLSSLVFTILIIYLKAARKVL